MSAFIFFDHSKAAQLTEYFYNMTEDDKKSGEYTKALSRLFEIASAAGFKGNLWHRLITEMLVCDENPYTKAAERKGKVLISLREAVLSDLSVIIKFYEKDVFKDAGFTKDIYEFTSDGKNCIYEPEIRDAINDLSKKLSLCRTAEELRDLLEDFYLEYGAGKFGLYKAFRLDRRADDKIELKPVQNIAVTSFDDLVGYEDQKRRLRENTESFLNGKSANNCLLYGESGTGKSSSIRALLNEYSKNGLRIIEVYKHQYREINDLIDSLKDRNYRFIIYMDDLSFEEFEVEYKYLKAVLEGGLESRPENVLIYATSNRRHLVREKFSDREERDNDKHINETVQEKISLYTRFGLTIYYGTPEQDGYMHIVKELAERKGILMPEEELYLEANKWEVSHSGFSGRTAAQFIDDLLQKKGMRS